MLNINFFLLFVLAHLTGDYVLQTNQIARRKVESLKGVALHTLIVGIVQLALLSCYGINGMIAGAVGTVIHYGIDCLKYNLNKRFKMELLLYLFDQGLHFLVLILLTLVFAPDNGWIQKYTLYVRLLTALALLLSAASVTAKTVARGFLTNVRKQSFFLGKERWVDTLTAGVLGLAAVLLIFAGPSIGNGPSVIAGIAIVVIGAYIYCLIQKKAYQYDWRASLLKYITLVIFALLAVGICSW